MSQRLASSRKVTTDVKISEYCFGARNFSSLS